MKNTKKTLLVIVAMILMCAMSAAVTLALYTATTDNVENTFTFGNVKITLDELDSDNDDYLADNEEYENPEDPENPIIRDTKNLYDIDPGLTYGKDPIIHNEGSETAWIRATVTLDKNVHDEFAQFYAIDLKNGGKHIDVLKNFVVDEEGNTTLNTTDWAYVGYFTNADGDYIYVFDYVEALAKETDTKAIFTKFTIPADWDPSRVHDNTKIERNVNFITVKGFAVQESGVSYTNAAAVMLTQWADHFTSPITAEQ